MRKVYIAGPMTGLPEFNYPAFDRTSKEWETRGWLAINPANHYNRTMEAEYSDYLRAAIHDLLIADALALLPGWSASFGACMELVVARGLGLPILDALTGETFEFEWNHGIELGETLWRKVSPLVRS